MKLILSRHGNTFGPNDPIVWAGTSNDLPLVEKGLEQAKLFAKALAEKKIIPKAIYSGPLQRTRRYAEILIEDLNLSQKPLIDERLNEIDYGEWTGRTNVEVKEIFGKEELTNWDEHSIWPKKGNWKSSPDILKKQVKSFILELIEKYKEEDTVIAVTSNGRLRYFLSLDTSEYEKRIKDGTFKVKTGHISCLLLNKTQVSVPYWNIDPSKLTSSS